MPARQVSMNLNVPPPLKADSGTSLRRQRHGRLNRSKDPGGQRVAICFRNLSALLDIGPKTLTPSVLAIAIAGERKERATAQANNGGLDINSMKNQSLPLASSL